MKLVRDESEGVGEFKTAECKLISQWEADSVMRLAAAITSQDRSTYQTMVAQATLAEPAIDKAIEFTQSALLGRTSKPTPPPGLRRTPKAIRRRRLFLKPLKWKVRESEVVAAV